MANKHVTLTITQNIIILKNSLSVVKLLFNKHQPNKQSSSNTITLRYSQKK